MYIIPIAWLYVALMMAVAEATSEIGTLLGAVITFVLYGLAPVLLVLYLMGAPGRRKANKAREDAAWKKAQENNSSTQPPVSSDTSTQPDAGRHAAAAAEGDVVAPMRKEL